MYTFITLIFFFMINSIGCGFSLYYNYGGLAFFLGFIAFWLMLAILEQSSILDKDKR